MNILVINGSPRTLGSCDRLIGKLLECFSREDRIKVFKPFEMGITPCNACGYCKAADGCSKKDLEEFLAYFAQADVIIVASPVYNYSMPAPIKALFDRFQRFYEANERGEQIFTRPKTAVLIVTAGCDGRIGFEVIKKQVEGGFKNMNTKLTASVLINGTDERQLSEADYAKVRELTRYI
jgi:multimeric flavodoxin WrbA